MSCEPNVAINGWICVQATSQPQIIPTIAPITIATMIQTTAGICTLIRRVGRSACCARDADTTADRAATAPGPRSIPADRMHQQTPQVMMPFTDSEEISVVRLPTVINFGRTAVRATARIISTNHMALSDMNFLKSKPFFVASIIRVSPFFYLAVAKSFFSPCA